MASAISRALGIGGGGGADTLEDDGQTEVNASATAHSSDVALRLFPRGKDSVADAPTEADADAAAMRGGAGDDALTTGEGAVLDVDASAYASDEGSSFSLSGLNSNPVQPHAIATAAGLEGASGADTLHHQGALDVHAEAQTEERDIEATLAGVTGFASDEVPSGAEARASGLAGGDGADTLRNDGSIEATSHSSSTHLGVGVTGPGYARPSPAGGASAVSTGLDGGGGADHISNPTGGIHARAEAEDTTDDVAISVLGIAGTFNGTNVASASATGVAGGDGDDTIARQEGEPEPPPADADAPALHAEALATAVSHDLSIGVLQSADVAAAPLATAAAKGIDAGVGADRVVNDREMRVETTADSSAIGAEIRIASTGALGGSTGGAKLSWKQRVAGFLGHSFTGLSGKFLTVAGLVVDNDVTSQGASTGIAGGAGGDRLDNQASVDARASASSSRVGVGISVATGAGVGASTRAVSDSTGMDGHGGADPIEPNVLQRVVAGLGFSVPFVSQPVQPPPDGADTLENHSTISASSSAHATANAVGAGISISVGSGSGGSGGGSGGGTKAAAAGGGTSAAASGGGSSGSGGGQSNKKPTGKQLSSKVRVKASSAAEATAAGIRGGAGADTIDNYGSIDLAGDETEDPRGGAHAVAEAGSVAVEIGGCKACYAAADALTSARSSAAGLDGEQDGDAITNHQTIDVLATAHSQARQLAFTTSGAAIDDVSLKFDWTDTRKAEATSAGIAGGSGADTLKNEAAAAITSTAEADSLSQQVSAAVKGVSLSVSSSLAQAEATGIDGAGGATLPEDRGSLIEFLARTRDRLVGLLPFEIPGLSPAPPPADLADTIENRGQVTARATAETKTLDVTGSYKGVSLATDSLWDQGVASTARAEGIDGGDGGDTITNFATGRIDTQANAFTRDISASLVYQGLAATSTSAHATAEGFGARGGDGDDHLSNDGTIVVGKQQSVDDEGIQALARGFQGSLAIEGVSGAIEPIHDSGVHASAGAHVLAGDDGADTLENHASASALSTSSAFGLSANIVFNGVTVTDSSVQSGARASGLEGDAGADTLTNDIAATDAKLRAEANAFATGVKLSAVYEGGAVTLDPFWHAGTQADARAVGADGGSGADGLTNGALLATPEDDGPLRTRDSRIEAEANATAWGVDIAGAVTGFAGVLASNEAVASATGMQGGADPELPQSKPREFVDRLTETIGDGYRKFVLGEEPVVPEADGVDVVTNYGTLDARADARSRGIEVGLNYEGVAAVVDPFADTGTIAEAVSRAIAGGVGNDQLFNHGNTLVKADSGAFGISGTFSMAGVAVVSAASLASSQATGIAGGEGDDIVRNDTRDANETLHAEATASATGLRAAVAVQGVAGAIDVLEAGTRADATATGLDGGAGADTVTHRGALEAISGATATGVSVSGGMYGVALASVDWEAHAHASGLRGGADSNPDDDVLADGADTVVNWGGIQASATSLARGLQGTFEFGGVAASGDPFAGLGADADSHAQALAGGDGDDVLANFGALDVDAKSTSWGVAADIAIYGVAIALASRSSLAEARGLDGGDGSDILTHARGLFAIDADAQVTSIDGTFTFGGVNVTAAPFWNDGSVATARATGLFGGAGADDLLFGERGVPNDADGLFSLTPDATIHAEANAFSLDAAITVFGLGGASLDTRAEASSTGVDGGAGVDLVENRRHLTVDADATSHTFEWSVTGVGLAAAVSPTLDVGSDAVATAIGLAGGGAPASDDPLQRDQVWNRDALDVDAVARMGSNSTAIALAGVAVTSTSAEARATASGLDGDGGPSLLWNEGGLDVLADARATGVDVGFSIVGASDSGGALGTRTYAKAAAAGLHGGSGDDELVNQHGETTDTSSPFSVKAEALSTSVAVDVTGALIALIATDVRAESDAYGLEGDEGDDVLWNLRPMRVEAESDVRGAEVGFLILGAGENKLGMGRYADARATGLDGGEGDDFASNEAHVTVIANGDARATRVQAVGAGYSEVAAYTDSYAKGTGMDGDSGNDHLINRGLLDLDVDATTTTADVAAALIGSLDASVWSSARADAEGLAGWFGDDVLENYGSILANAHAEPSSKNVEASIIGEPKADTVGIATANAWGLSAGAGEQDVLLNHAGASIDVTASSLADAHDVQVTVLGAVPGGAGAESHANAYGLFSFEGTTRTENHGTLDVLADADAVARSISVVGSGGVDSDPDQGFGPPVEPGVTAQASAFGVHGGPGYEEIHNTSLIDVDANATSDANGVQVDVGGRTQLVSGAEARADAHGIRTFYTPDDPDPEDPEPPPDAGDLVVNEGTLDARAVSRAHSHGRAITVVGGGKADSVQLADAKAWGIETGDGDDTVRNTGTVAVSADALSSADDNAIGAIGHHTSNGAVTADSTATGVDLGAGADALDSQKIDVSSVADLPVDSDAIVPIGASRSEGLGLATARAHGVVGSGDNTIVNRERISAYARSSAFVEADSGAISAGVAANATGNAYAWGADLGGGNDRLENHATISSRAQVTNASDTGNFEANADATGLDASARADARSEVTSTGARFGDGDDAFWNAQGAVVDVDAKVRIEAESDANAASTDATSFASTSAVATGLELGAGDDYAEIAGSFDVSSDPNVRAEADALGVPGDAEADARSAGRAFGLRLGTGDDRVLLSGAGHVSADADAYADADGDGLGDADGDGDARSRGQAVGIELGNGDDVVEITGSLDVVSRVQATGVGDGDDAGEGDARAVGFARAIGINVLEIPSDDAANDAQAIEGAGNKTIINRGSIVAHTELSLTANGSGGWRGSDASPSRVGDEQAFGIQTADGDDVIENYGRIEAYTSGGAGIAVDTGAGRDRVRLGAESLTRGEIRLRAGDDELELDDGFQLQGGGVEAGAGDRDTLTFRGAGSFGRSDFHGFEALRKTGAGEFQVTAHPGAGLDELRVEEGRLRIDPSVSGEIREIRIARGELELMQSFAFRDDGHLAVQFFPDGSSGQLLVNGLASLAGELEVRRGAGVFTRDVSYDLLRASAFRGEFDDVILPPDVPLLDFELSPLPDALAPAALAALAPMVFSVDVLPFTSVAGNRVQRSIGGYLDEVLPVAEGDVLAMLGEFQMLTEPSQLDAAFSSLSPDSYDGVTRAGLDAARDCTRAFHRRVERVREGRTGSKQASEANGAWAEGAGNFAEQDGGDGFRGYDAHGASARVGYDRELGSGLVAGGGVCYGGVDLDFEQHADADIEELGALAYGSWSAGHAYLEASLGYAHQWYDQNRAVSVGTLGGTARSDYDGDLLSAGVGSGWRFAFGRSNVEPFGSLYLAYLDQDGFSETGPPGATLRVRSQQTTSLVSDVGVRFWHPVELGVGQLMPRFSAAWSHDYDPIDRDLTVSLEGAPGSYTLDGQSIDRDSARVEAGLGFRRGALSLQLDYQGDFRGDATSNGVSGNLLWSF